MWIVAVCEPGGGVEVSGRPSGGAAGGAVGMVNCPGLPDTGTYSDRMHPSSAMARMVSMSSSCTHSAPGGGEADADGDGVADEVGVVVVGCSVDEQAISDAAVTACGYLGAWPPTYTVVRAVRMPE